MSNVVLGSIIVVERCIFGAVGGGVGSWASIAGGVTPTYSGVSGVGTWTSPAAGVTPAYASGSVSDLVNLLIIEAVEIE